jgi:hypothetical protein
MKLLLFLFFITFYFNVDLYAVKIKNFKSDYCDSKFMDFRAQFQSLRKISSKRLKKVNRIFKWKIWFSQNSQISIAEFDGKKLFIEHINWSGYCSVIPPEEDTSETFAQIPIVMDKLEFNDTVLINKISYAIDKIFGIDSNKNNTYSIGSGSSWTHIDKNEFILEVYENNKSEPVRLYKKFKESVFDEWCELANISKLYKYDLKNEKIYYKTKCEK